MGHGGTRVDMDTRVKPEGDKLGKSAGVLLGCG